MYSLSNIISTTSRTIDAIIGNYEVGNVAVRRDTPLCHPRYRARRFKDGTVEYLFTELDSQRWIQLGAPYCQTFEVGI